MLVEIPIFAGQEHFKIKRTDLLRPGIETVGIIVRGERIAQHSPVPGIKHPGSLLDHAVIKLAYGVMDKPCQKPRSGKGKRKPAPEQHFPGKQRFKNLHNSLAALFNLPGISESPDVTARKKNKDSDLSVSILKIRHAAIIPAYS